MRAGKRMVEKKQILKRYSEAEFRRWEEILIN